MNEELSAQVAMTERLAMVVQVLEQRTAASIEEQQKAGHALQHAIATVRNDVNQLVEGSGHQVAVLVKQGVDLALSQAFSKYEQMVNVSTVKIDSAGRSVEKVLHETSGFVHRQIWFAYGAIAGAILLLVTGGGIALWMQRQAYTDARDRTASAQVEAQLMEAFHQVGVTSCGGRPCLELDTKSPRWGSKGEYVLISAAPKQKPN